jgi:nitrogen fixation NifU-like protein
VTVDAKTLYQALILDHAKHPRREGALPGATHEATATNPLCGDRVTVRVRVEGGVVEDVRFEAKGCMIARASASILAETIAGRTTTDALALEGTLQALAAGPEPPREAGPLEPLRSVRAFPARVGCVTLAWSCLQQALRG